MLTLHCELYKPQLEPQHEFPMTTDSHRRYRPWCRRIPTQLHPVGDGYKRSVTDLFPTNDKIFKVRGKINCTYHQRMQRGSKSLSEIGETIWHTISTIVSTNFSNLKANNLCKWRLTMKNDDHIKLTGKKGFEDSS